MTLKSGAALAVTLVVAAVCVRLGFWQLERLDARRELNARYSSAAVKPPLLVTPAVLARIAADPQAFLFRQVVLRGRYDAARDFIVRGRAFSGRPGVDIVTPLLLDSSAAILVNRGWAPSPDAATVTLAGLAERGHREVHGVVLPMFPGNAAARAVPRRKGAFQLQRVTAPAADSLLPYPVPPVIVQQQASLGPAADPPLVRRPIPPADDGPHLGYALQWFAFAAIALTGAIFISAAARRPA